MALTEGKAIVIKNLPDSVRGFIMLEFILNSVLIIVANKKNKINHGNIFNKDYKDYCSGYI